MKFELFLECVPKIKNLPLPAQASQFKMVPPFRHDLVERYKERMQNARKAGVMALFYPNESFDTKLALILRKTYHGVHSAQIGFPGGKLEPEDTNLEQAALRETYEEIGVPHDQIEVVRSLTEVYIPPSNFNVKPFIGFSKEQPVFTPQDEEVEKIVPVFLSDFLDDSSIIETDIQTSYSPKVKVPAFLLEGHVVWGATAMMLSEIKDLLKQSF